MCLHSKNLTVCSIFVFFWQPAHNKFWIRSYKSTFWNRTYPWWFAIAQPQRSKKSLYHIQSNLQGCGQPWHAREGVSGRNSNCWGYQCCLQVLVHCPLWQVVFQQQEMSNPSQDLQAGLGRLPSTERELNTASAWCKVLPLTSCAPETCGWERGRGISPYYFYQKQGGSRKSLAVQGRFAPFSPSLKMGWLLSASLSFPVLQSWVQWAMWNEEDLPPA